jgi:hypothetical protein
MSFTQEEIPGVVKILLDKVNSLSAIVEVNNKLQKADGFFSAADLQKVFWIGPKILKKLLVDNKIKEYRLDNLPVYKISEIWAAVEEIKKEREVSL